MPTHVTLTVVDVRLRGDNLASRVTPSMGPYFPDPLIAIGFGNNQSWHRSFDQGSGVCQLAFASLDRSDVP